MANTATVSYEGQVVNPQVDLNNTSGTLQYRPDDQTYRSPLTLDSGGHVWIRSNRLTKIRVNEIQPGFDAAGSDVLLKMRSVLIGNTGFAQLRLDCLRDACFWTLMERTANQEIGAITPFIINDYVTDMQLYQPDSFHPSTDGFPPSSLFEGVEGFQIRLYFFLEIRPTVTDENSQHRYYLHLEVA